MWNLHFQKKIKNTMSKRDLKNRGTLPSAHLPSREKYKCPVKNCNSELRGDDISKHFQKNSNLVELEKANENHLILKKCDKEECSNCYF